LTQYLSIVHDVIKPYIRVINPYFRVAHPRAIRDSPPRSSELQED
jgi:hypothetical protein